MDSSSLSKTTASALYSPLAEGEFRTLMLFPGDPNDPIRVRLQPASLSLAPEYEALSYVWGDPHNTIDILCNDLPTPVTTNLHAALVRVRSARGPRVLWADALCINQQDKAERGHQVGMMAKIYSSARFVLAYLGTSPDHAGGKAIASLLRECTPDMEKFKDGTEDPRWKSFGPLLENRWFTRAWVVQEVGLAKNPRVLYDEVDFSYRQLMGVVEWLFVQDQDFFFHFNVHLPYLHVIWPDWREQSQVMLRWGDWFELVDLLEWAARLACLDPRDHIYAFLGHPLTKSMNRAVIPDYKTEVSQVYKEVTQYLLAQTGIRALCFVTHTNAALSHLGNPSWVIHWDGRHFWPISRDPAHFPRGACDDRPRAQIRPDNDALLIRGLEVDTVRDVYRVEAVPARLSIITRSANSRAFSLEEFINLTNTISSRNRDIDSRAQDLAWTLCAGIGYHKIEESNLLEAWNAYRLWVRSPSAYDSMPHLAYMFFLGVHIACYGRALVVTEKGYYALAPTLSQPGDMCCMFDGGGNLPFICRPRVYGGSKGPYRDVRLVGEAYVRGLDQRQALGMLERGEAEERAFRIT